MTRGGRWGWGGGLGNFGGCPRLYLLAFRGVSLSPGGYKMSLESHVKQGMLASGQQAYPRHLPGLWEAHELQEGGGDVSEFTVFAKR